MKKTLLALLLVLLVLVPERGWTQVTTEPPVPFAAQPVRIIYDATKGTSGLKDCNCDVYIHLGAVTESPASTTWSLVPFQWGTANPAAKMTKVEGQANLYTFELTPNSFFSNPNGLPIYRLGIVFRNADGSKEGKTTSNSDFFINLAQGFQILFTQPQTNQLSLQTGESFEFKAEASETADLSLELDGTKVSEKLASKEITYSFLAEQPGTYQLTAKAQKGAETDTETVTITVFAPSEVASLPPGARLGINYLSSTEVILALQAPKKNIVHVIGDFNDWKVLPDFQMKRTPDGEIFWLKLSGLIPKQEYIFQYLVDGEIRIGDPYADKTSDPFHDQEIIDQGRYPGLKPFPNGKTNFQATYLQTDQTPFVWKNVSYSRPSPEELVVYELLVRDFDERRTYKAVLERLDYLKSLGVNAIELMPVGEFEGNLSWGYNPSFFFAPDKYYGTKNELKELIDAAHGKGIMVILDLVLNHAFGQSPMVRLYNDGDYGAPTLDNPWFNREAKHPFNVGYDFNHESTYTKAFVDSVNSYWLTEYKMDGIRFDLSKGFTQVNSGNNVGTWSQYDPSRIKIWKHIYDKIKAKHPEAYVILEHLSENSEEKELADYGLMFWGNMNGTSRNLAKGNNDNMQGAYFKNRGWLKNHLIAYQESHDEERVMWESLNFGLTSPLNLKNLENAVNRHQIMTAFYFAIPGPKMLWQFGEFGYDLELNNDRLGIKPTRWEYLNNPERNRLFRLYQEMISLKNQHAVFSKPSNATINLNGTYKSIHLTHPELEVFLIGNFDLETRGGIQVQFPKTGKWYNYFTGEEITLSSTQRTIGFRPNEFYLFTDKPLPTPESGILQTDYITGIPEAPSQDGLKMYPVPTQGTLTVELPAGMSQINYRVLDMSGRVVMEGKSLSGNQNLDLYLGEITRGIYIFEAFDTKRVVHQRFIKN